MGRAKENVSDTDFEYIDEWSAWKAMIAMAQSSDAFGKHISDITQTKADIGSEYPFNPERLRFYDGGNRVFLQYVSSSKFDDKKDSWTLLPNAGNTLRLETAERYRYTVGNVVSVSRAFQANKTVDELQGDDKIVLGYGRPDLENDMAGADGWFWEWDSALDKAEVRLTEYRDGDRVYSNVVGTNKNLTDWRRIEDRFNWYNVGNDEKVETFTREKKDGDIIQVNDTVGKTGHPGSKGPVSGNKHVTFSVRTDAKTTDLELDCGSIGVMVLGNHTPQVRGKAADLGGDFEASTLSYSATNLYEPLFAIRRDPDRGNISNDFVRLDLNEFSTNADSQILVVSVDQSKTDAGETDGWETPNEHNPVNSAIEITEDVSSYPDVDGNVVDGTTGTEYVDDPGGFQLGLANSFVEGSGTANIRRNNTARFTKRKLQNGDIAVVLGLSDSTGDFSVTFDTEQDF